MTPAEPVATYRGSAIAARRAGPATGPKVLLLHGIGSNSRSFRPQLEGLADSFDLASWDAPGYGASDDPRSTYTLDDFADAAAAVLDGLGWAAAHVLGHSFGGVVAQAVYHRHPARVRALVLSDTNAGSGSLPEPQRSERVRRRLDDLATRSPRQIAELRSPNLLAPGAPPELLAEVVDVMAEIRPAGYGAAAVAMGTADLRARLASIAVPTLVIHGEQDTVIPPSVAQELVQAIPGARLELLRGAGHASNQQAPEAYNAAVREFLSSCGLHRVASPGAEATP